MSQTLKQEREAIEKQRRENQKLDAILFFKRTYPSLDTEANLNVIISYIADEPVTRQTVETATAILRADGRITELPAARVQARQEEQKVTAEQQAVRHRIDLEAALISETKESNRDHVRRSLKYETNEQLKLRLDQLRAKKKLQGMTGDEIRAFLKNARQQPEIQPEIVSLTKEQIQKLTAQEYRALLFDRSGREKPGVRQQIENIMRGQ